MGKEVCICMVYDACQLCGGWHQVSVVWSGGRSYHLLYGTCDGENSGPIDREKAEALLQYKFASLVERMMDIQEELKRIQECLRPIADHVMANELDPLILRALNGVR